jgi:serine phosphatase RsbU (regulator of sigma subunit)
MKTPTIICVNDEKSILKKISTELTAACGNRCIIKTAENGFKALEILAQLKQNDQLVPLLITKQHLPQMNGTELLTMVKEISPKTLSVLLCEKASNADLIDLINTAALFRYIALPLNLTELKRAVDDAIDKYFNSNEEESEIDLLIKKQSVTLEKQNKQLAFNMDYAGQSQKALLPLESERTFPYEYFIYYHPKQAASGDIYWYLLHDDIFYFAVIDCSGQGIPGAFMTVIANNLLYRIIKHKGVTEPSLILNELHKGIMGILKQKKQGLHDSINISLITVDKKNQKSYFAGAQGSVVFVNQGEITEIEGDKYPVGGHPEINRNFTKYEIDILEDMTFYMYTAGYMNQKGGDKGKRFSPNRLQEVLLDIHSKPMDEQRELLVAFFDFWKGKHEQTDDVLIVGFKLD